ncbi:MAG: hypothetical protein ABI725_06015 [Chloroflexota bacterium]
MIQRAILVALLVSLALQALLAADPQPTRASQYNNTDPASTPCGNGSHTVKTWRDYYLRSGTGAIVARVDTRYSHYCNTVWTRVTNLTGPGHYPATSLVVQARTYTYACSQGYCYVQGTAISSDTAPANGDSGWSRQLDLPVGVIISGSRMPPTVRSQGWAFADGVNAFKDSGREPVFTQWKSNFSNDPGERTGTRVLSCDNSDPSTSACTSWGTPEGSWATLYAEIAPSFALAGVDERTDLENIIDKWNYASQNSPLTIICASTCAEDIIVSGVSTQGAFGLTLIDLDNGAQPALAQHAYMKISTKYTYDHSCGAEGDGCVGGASGFDDRPVLSHEWAHALGFTHCDLNFGVMCHITAKDDDDNAEGTMFWTPQLRDVWGLEAAYP